jgi:hypothetical protein
MAARCHDNGKRGLTDMAWPPPTLAINRTNATPQLDTHAADHNALALAVNDITTKVKQLVRVGANAPLSGDLGFGIGPRITLCVGANLQNDVAGSTLMINASVALQNLQGLPASATVNPTMVPPGGSETTFGYPHIWLSRTDGEIDMVNVSAIVTAASVLGFYGGGYSTIISKV